MKWISHCILLTSEISAAQYHWLVTVLTLGTGSGCFVDLPGPLHPTSCPEGWVLPVHSWALLQALLLAKEDALAAGSIFSLWQSNPKSVWSYKGLALASGLRGSAWLCVALRGSAWLLTGSSEADWDLGHSWISVQPCPPPSLTSLFTSQALLLSSPLLPAPTPQEAFCRLVSESVSRELTEDRMI